MTGSVRVVNRHGGMALSACVVLAGCGGGSSKGAQPATSTTTATTVPTPMPTSGPSGMGDAVTVKLFAFTPAALTVKAGTKVTWTNFDEILHTVTTGTPPTGPATFDGKLDGKGTSFAFTFDRPGVYKYFCQRHPEAMTGEVDVT